jgi:hypothetical protein
VHFAAHAVADDAYPERSAVVLAAGDAKQDGLLQAREIEALDLDGRIVVLSACYTAGGAVLSGEGVLSLASQALSARQAEARAAGRPPSAWAALVLLGNGDLRPFAGAGPQQSSSTHLLAFGLVVSAALALWRYREGKRHPRSFVQ